MIRTFIFFVFVLCLSSPGTIGLDPIVVANGQFVHRHNNSTYRPLGIYYQPSNDTTFDALSDPDACLRDAALFQKLGINHLGVSLLSEQPHDECLDEFREMTWSGDIHKDYNNPDFMGRIFRLVNAFKDYENIGVILVTGSYSTGEFSGLAQPYIRALVRDIRQYLSHHSNRTDIPIGFSRDFSYPSTPTFVMKTAQLQYALDYARCQIPDEPDDASIIDFFASGLRDVIFANMSQQEYSNEGIHYNTFRDLESLGTPVLLQQYRQVAYNDSNTLPVATNDFNITKTLYNNHSIRETISGALVSSWANFVSYERNFADFGLVELDRIGNLRLRPAYESFKQTLDQINLPELMNGPKVAETTFVKPCTSGVSEVYDWNGNESTTMTFNNSWALPTPPPEVMAMIESGVDGLRGSHVDVTQTLVKQTVYDVHGSILSNLAITPSPSSPRATVSSPGDVQTAQKNDLHLKVGLAVGLLLATLAIAVVGSFALRRRKANRKKTSNPQTKDSGQLDDPWPKPELSDQACLAELDRNIIGAELGDHAVSRDSRTHMPSPSELQGNCISELHGKPRIP